MEVAGLSFTSVSDISPNTSFNIPQINIRNNNESDTSSDTVSMAPISVRAYSARPNANYLVKTRQKKAPNTARVKNPESACCLLI